MAAREWNIILVRHGATTWSASGRFTGHQDVPMSETGVRQAHRIAAQLRSPVPELILTSDLLRARQTATAIAEITGYPEAEIAESAALREERLGCWEGKTRAQVAESSPHSFARWEAGDIGCFDGREGLIAVAARALPLLKAYTNARPKGSGRLVVVTHSNTIAAIVGTITGAEPKKWPTIADLSPAEAIALRRDPSEWRGGELLISMTSGMPFDSMNAQKEGGEC